MGLIRNELLSLDLIPPPPPPPPPICSSYIPKSITDFVKQVSLVNDVDQRVCKFDEFINSLEEEMKKIDAFKRELPLCIVLLHDAVNYLKKESLVQCKARNVEPVLEEFIPLKKNCDDEDDDDDGENEIINKEKDNRDKKNWMRSVQLWNTDDNSSPEFPYNPKQNFKSQDSKQRKQEETRTFVPLKEYLPFAMPFRDSIQRKENKEAMAVHALSFLTPGTKNLGEKSGSNGLDKSRNRALSSASPVNQSNLRNVTHQPQQQTSRKQRRCWSPDLHRRFVSALQQLGGSQVATPKQIRELMQVDGLTNDEVKSHLQKYRLHTKRIPGSQSAASANQSVVALGGLWPNSNQYGESLKNSGDSQSGSPEGPLQLPGNTGGTSITGDDSMEDDEDDKSESYSWKSHVHNPGRDNA